MRKIIGALLVLAFAVPAFALDLAIVTDGELWTREAAPDISYDNDGLNVYNDNVLGNSNIHRETLIQFDLSGVDFTPGAYVDVCLELWSLTSWSSNVDPVVTEAAIYHTAGVGVAGEYDSPQSAHTLPGVAMILGTWFDEPVYIESEPGGIGRALDLIDEALKEEIAEFSNRDVDAAEAYYATGLQWGVDRIAKFVKEWWD